MKIEPKTIWVNIHTGEKVFVLETVGNTIKYEKQNSKDFKKKFEKPIDVFLRSYSNKQEEKSDVSSNGDGSSSFSLKLTSKFAQ